MCISPMIQKLYFGTNEDAFIEYVTDDGVVDALSISGSISRGNRTLSGTAIFVDAVTIANRQYCRTYKPLFLFPLLAT